MSKTTGGNQGNKAFLSKSLTALTHRPPRVPPHSLVVGKPYGHTEGSCPSEAVSKGFSRLQFVVDVTLPRGRSLLLGIAFDLVAAQGRFDPMAVTMTGATGDSQFESSDSHE